MEIFITKKNIIWIKTLLQIKITTTYQTTWQSHKIMSVERHSADNYLV